MFYDWKWKEAFDELQKAIQLNPSAIDAYQLLGYYYLTMGQKQKAVETLEDAEKIDPLSPVISQSLGNMYLFAGRYDEAIVQADKMLDLNPTMRISIEMKGWATGMKGDWETALEFFKEVHRLTNHPLKGLIGLALLMPGWAGRKSIGMYPQNGTKTGAGTWLCFRPRNRCGLVCPRKS